MKYYIYIIQAIFIIPFTVLNGQISVCMTCEVKSIKEAINLAVDGTKIIVDGGIYQEGNIVINKSIILQGKNLPILDGGLKHEIITIIADHVTIEGFKLQNVGTSHLEDRAAIRIKNSKEFTVQNNELYNTFFGIYCEHSSKGTIQNNNIIGKAEEEMNSGNAIHLWYSKHIKVKNNNVQHHRDGIYLEFVDFSHIENNTSTDNLRYGLHFMFSNNDTYSKNTFSRNGAGVAVMFSKNINMNLNTFSNNWGKSSYGLLLKEIYDAEIVENTFKQNTIGIFVEGSTRINYFKNDLIQNGWAIKISGGCLDNKIESNNFIGNSFDMSLASQMNENFINGNYWSSYSGYDLDKNGTGDIPYRPVKLFNFIIDKTPEALVLLRSSFVELINFSEKVSPIFTPKNVMDHSPKMQIIDRSQL